jgi:uncharacterized protein (TIGR02001 family)
MAVIARQRSAKSQFFLTGTSSARLTCVLLCCSAAFSVRAAENGGGSISLTNDYVYRGISLTQGDSAVQASGYVQPIAGVTLGVWGSSLSAERRPWAHYEVDLFASKSWALDENWSARLSLTHFAYLQGRVGSRFDHDEVGATLSFRERLNATIAWLPNLATYDQNQIERHSAQAYEITGVQPVAGAWSLYAGLGYYDLRSVYPRSYWYWNTGVAFTWQSLQLDVQHIDTDGNAETLFGPQSTGSRWVASVNWHF